MVPDLWSGAMLARCQQRKKETEREEMTLTYSDAQSLISKAREPRNGKPLQNNTRLYRRGNDYAVRLHATDVVTIHPGDTYSLSSGGWLTVTTKDRINGWSPARVGSATTKAGPVWCVWHASDPVTAPKITKCRTCKGTGETVSPGYVQTYGQLEAPAYEVTERLAWSADYSSSVRIVGQVVRHDTGDYWRLPEPIVHPDTVHTCYRCNGSKVHDYGSKPNPVRFYDGITVDSSGKVTDPGAARLYDVVASDADNEAVLKAIAAYVAGLTDSKISELWHYATSEGVAGDCWFCSMFERPSGGAVISDGDHLRSHICLGDDADDEPYYMASLIRNAIESKGYRYPEVIFSMGADHRSERDASRIRELVSRYLRKRLVTDRPVR